MIRYFQNSSTNLFYLVILHQYILDKLSSDTEQTEKIKASDLLVKCLETEKVEYIFGIPGEENADLMMSLLDSDKIHFNQT